MSAPASRGGGANRANSNVRVWDVESLGSGSDISIPKPESAVGSSSADAQLYAKRVSDALKFSERDFLSTAWWAKPMLAAVRSERFACGWQQRPLLVATACSGTESPLFGLQAGAAPTTFHHSVV